MNNDEKYNAVISAMPEFTYDWKHENYDDPSKPILKITKSSLGSFDWCAKKYDFSYIQRFASRPNGGYVERNNLPYFKRIF